MYSPIDLFVSVFMPTETSVTIPDCTIVIDTAREKQSSYDPTNRMPLLVEHFASKASLKQRRGRAGRVREGTCYKLISRATYAKLRDHGEPEIQRCALDQTLLSLLFLGVERGSGTFMRTLLDPPSKESLAAAAFSLRKVGAVEPDGQGGDLRLTPLGVHLAGIPAPPTVGKMLVMGSILGCRTPALAMAAGITLGRSPFLRIDTRRKKRNNGDDERASIEEMKQERVLEERSSLFKTVGNSDHALLAAVYMKWQDTGNGSGLRKRFCDSLGLSFTGMRDMMQLVNQMDASLRAAGYAGSAEADSHAHSWRIIRACAVSAMAPSQLVKVRRPAATYQETAEGAREKDGEARGLKFFVRIDNESSSVEQTSRDQEERVFIHPSSANFQTGSYNCQWLVYHSLVRTSKAFLRDVTECSAYALLLFGGELEVQAARGLILVDGWAQLSANARIGSLIGGLRKQVDELLTKKVVDPSFELANTDEMNLIVKLIRTDGLGT
jgi:ATP-dependent RNA helicase DHX57